MQQKEPTQLQHQFIRKHKRKLSPKNKQQQLYAFKSSKLQLKKEEYTLGVGHKQHTNNQAQIVLDLKNQLSFLKEQMAKIVHSKLQSVPNDQQNNKLKLLDYYFPREGDKTTTVQSLHSDGSTDIHKTSMHEPSSQKCLEMKKIKSKERLKFSKIKKSQKFSPISPPKNIDITTQPSQNISHSEHHQKPTHSNTPKQPTQPPKLNQQLQRISQRNKKALELKLKSLVWQQQQNIDINSTSHRFPIKKEDESKDALKLLSLTPQKEQKPAVYELKITRLKKKIKETEQELERVKGELKERSDQLIKIETQFQRVNLQLNSWKKQLQKKQHQLTEASDKVTQLTIQTAHLSSLNTRQTEQLKLSQTQVQTFKQQNGVLEHKLKNREYEILKLQRNVKNHEQQYKGLTEKTNGVIDSLKGELKIWRQNCEREIEERNKVIKQLERREREKMGRQEELANKTSNKQQPQLGSSFLPSPRGNPVSGKQKQYLIVIKMHQKSIQNYQKDLNFLEAECKNLNQFKLMAKKQEVLIKDVNELLLNEQLLRINAKYEKRGMGNVSSGKEIQEMVTKRPSARLGQQVFG